MLELRSIILHELAVADIQSTARFSLYRSAEDSEAFFPFLSKRTAMFFSDVFFATKRYTSTDDTKESTAMFTPKVNR